MSLYCCAATLASISLCCYAGQVGVVSCASVGGNWGDLGSGGEGWTNPSIRIGTFCAGASAAGFDPAFVSRALATSNEDMWTPSATELLAAGAITSVSDGSQFAASGYGAEVTKTSVAENLTQALPALAIMRDRLPDAYNSVIDGWYDGYVNGQTESEIVANARAKMLSVVSANLPLADNSVLVDYATLTAEQTAALGKKDLTLCYVFASGSGGTRNFVPDMPPSLVQRELEIQGRVLATAAKRPKISDKVTGPLWETVGSRIGADRIELLYMQNIQPNRYGDYCRASVALFQEIVSLRPDHAAALLREIWSGNQGGTE